MPIEIINLEDDDERRETPRIPTQAQRAYKAGSRVPPPPQAGTTWYVCGNGSCIKVGHVASGPGEDQVHQDIKRCPECRGLGIDVAAEQPCERCQGRGRYVAREWTESPHVPCPWCKTDMEFLQQGGFPAGYPRMDTPHSDKDSDMSGNVSFGRTRIVE